MTLDEIDRVHDDDPARAADGLRALDAAAVAADRLPLLGFLLLHVLGEKLGRWDEAAERLDALCAARGDAPPAVVAHAAAAVRLAGRDDGAALAALGVMGGATAAETVVGLVALAMRPPAETPRFAAELQRLAQAARALDADGPLKQRLAIGLNNATSALLDRAGLPVEAAVAQALRAGSEAALRFWRAAGTWVNHERALYLRALVHNRVGDAAAAREDCRQALAIIDAHGTEDVDRAFLQLQLAGAQAALGDDAEAARALAEAQAAAAQWDDAGLKSWFEEERAKLFGIGGRPA
jgi:hypothetical protein